MSKKFLLILAIGLTLLPAVSACTKSASSQAPLATPTATSKFPYPFPTADNPMSMLQQYATQTAMAGGAPALQPATITPVPAGGTTITPVTPMIASPTSTLLTLNLPTATSTIAVVTLPPATPGRPSTYTLQVGEFPYCIARRFNVNPDELLSLNNLSDGGLYMAGLVLKIPQTGNPFPAARALHLHPATYTVSADDTIYSIACHYGDVDPLAIARANNLPAPYALHTGQILNIP